MSDSAVVDVPVIMLILLIIAAPAILIVLALKATGKVAKSGAQYAKDHPEVVIAGLETAGKAAPLLFV